MSEPRTVNDAVDRSLAQSERNAQETARRGELAGPAVEKNPLVDELCRGRDIRGPGAYGK